MKLHLYFIIIIFFMYIFVVNAGSPKANFSFVKPELKNWFKVFLISASPSLCLNAF